MTLAVVTAGAQPSLDDFRLPPKAIFDAAMPRYPNVWFYVDPALAASHDDAVTLVTDGLRKTMRLREYVGPFDNPEGCDFEARIEHLQPWLERSERALQHAHSFHMRYYYSALRKQNLDRVEIRTAAGAQSFYRFAASVHYEVEHHNPNHADVEACPICGRTGAYASMQGSLVEMVHDPLGLELVLTGKIRGQAVSHEDFSQAPVGAIANLPDVRVRSAVFDAATGDRNTLRIAVVVLTPRSFSKPPSS